MFIKILVSLGLSICLVAVESFFESSFLYKFFSENLIPIILTLLAINAPTLGIILSKLGDILRKKGREDSFEKTKKEISFSIWEQFFLVFIALVLIIIMESSWISAIDYFPKLTQLFLVGLGGVFFYDILIFIDVAKASFMLIEKENESNA